MPSGWRAAGGLYKLQYSHPLCGNSLAQVVAVSMGQTLVINGTRLVAVTELLPMPDYSLMLQLMVVSMFIFLTVTLKISSAVDSSRKLVLKPDAYVTKEWAGAEYDTLYTFNKNATNKGFFFSSYV